MMDRGWDDSARAWIAAMGERGDASREHILDPAMLERLEGRRFRRALDVGCGEGRFCRMLAERGIPVIGIDPTRALLDAAIARDPGGDYRETSAESLPFGDDSFDLVICYLSLIDIPDFRAAYREMARVLAPGGTLLIANLSGIGTARVGDGWVCDDEGGLQYWPIDRYLDEFPTHAEWSGISVINWHRPLSAYMQGLLDLGLRLTFFDYPIPRSGDPARRARYQRMPWFIITEWEAPPGPSPAQS